MTGPVPPGGPDDCTRCQGFDDGRCGCERLWPADYPPGQTGLFDLEPNRDAAQRRHAWARYDRLEQQRAAAAGPVDQALTVEATATARLGVDIAEGLIHEIADTTGLAFCGFLREDT